MNVVQIRLLCLFVIDAYVCTNCMIHVFKAGKDTKWLNFINSKYDSGYYAYEMKKRTLSLGYNYEPVVMWVGKRRQGLWQAMLIWRGVYRERRLASYWRRSMKCVRAVRVGGAHWVFSPTTLSGCWYLSAVFFFLVGNLGVGTRSGLQKEICGLPFPLTDNESNK